MAFGSNQFIQSDLSTQRQMFKFLDLSLNPGTYDIAQCFGGDIIIRGFSVYCSVPGATFTSISIQTDQQTPFVLMSSAEGIVANLTGNNNIVTANSNKAFIMRNGQKIRYTISGSQGTGELIFAFSYLPLQEGAKI